MVERDDPKENYVRLILKMPIIYQYIRWASLHKYKLYISLALGVCFTTKVECKGPVPGVATEAFGEYDIPAVLAHDEYFILIINDFIGNPSYMFKSFFMGCNGQFRGEIPVGKPHIFEPGT